jgi:peroxiredoxin Q/BCP
MGLQVGDRAPEFSLPSSTGEKISLTGLRGKKVVLYFYPKDDTPGCTIEACGFRDVEAEMTEAGAVVLGVSADDLGSHDKFISKFDLNFPLLADEDKVVANAYGSWGEKQSRGTTGIGMIRKTFLIDEAGKLQKIWQEVTPEGHAEELLEVIKAGQA